jgi:hypothetical protein
VSHAPPGQERGPDLFAPVLGFRQWRVVGETLRSLYADDPWRRGVNEARCLVDGGAHPEPAPGHGCTCGIHAWYRPCPRLGSAATRDLVAGAVALWGEVELHPTGLRAQYGMVVALALPPSRGAKRRRLLAAARALEVEAVPARRLVAVARGHAEPVARSLVPAPVFTPRCDSTTRWAQSKL